MRFDQVNMIGSSFEFMNSVLYFFKNSIFIETDFTEANLTDSVFDSWDPKQTVFEITILKKLNSLASLNIKIDFENNNVRGTSFSPP